MRAAIYARVSTDEQAGEGKDSLAERLALARSSLIRLAIIKYLEKPEPPKPE